MDRLKSKRADYSVGGGIVRHLLLCAHYLSVQGCELHNLFETNYKSTTEKCSSIIVFPNLVFNSLISVTEDAHIDCFRLVRWDSSLQCLPR